MRHVGESARFGKPSLPGPVPILPPKRINGIPGPGSWLIVAHLHAPAKQGKGADYWMPFALLVILLVLAVVALVLIVFLSVQRWL